MFELAVGAAIAAVVYFFYARSSSRALDADFITIKPKGGGASEIVKGGYYLVALQSTKSPDSGIADVGAMLVARVVDADGLGLFEVRSILERRSGYEGVLPAVGDTITLSAPAVVEIPASGETKI